MINMLQISQGLLLDCAQQLFFKGTERTLMVLVQPLYSADEYLPSIQLLLGSEASRRPLISMCSPLLLLCPLVSEPSPSPQALPCSVAKSAPWG